MTDRDRDIERLLRELAPQVLAAVARRHSDFSAAEDAVQEALIAAATQWASDGIPANPSGWIYSVALRRVTDQIRTEIARRRREETIAGEVWAEWAFVPPPEVKVGVEQDDALLLLFMSCHPSLTPASAVALTLRAVGGLTTGEIARAFLVPEATMAQRISRAKQTIKSSKIAFAMPNDDELSARLASVLQIIYLIFTEGYTTSSGPSLSRTDLSNEAIRLARSLHAVRPGNPEIAGLLALMLLTDARRPARTDEHGAIVPLDEQDRSRWDRAMIDEGIALLSSVLPRGQIGPYQLQAAIAAAHDEATSTDATDWAQIALLYEMLGRFSDNPMVRLNHAVAIAMVRGPAIGLELLDELESDERIRGHHRLDAVRAHLYERMEDKENARRFYLAAADRTSSVPERNYLLMKAARAT
jgi:RNA polymerase sigma factor (sigma-70 family)